MSDSPATTATEIVARVADDIMGLSPDQWQACAGTANPFISHDFLSAMEESGSIGVGTGWKSLPIIIEDETGEIAACMPSYLKSHSQGEYIFDQQWAHAFESAGGQYYPKIQIASPFSPVPGPRLLLRDENNGFAAATRRRTNGREQWNIVGPCDFYRRRSVALFQRSRLDDPRG